MMGRFENLNLFLRKAFLWVLFGVFCMKKMLHAVPLEPFDMHFHAPEEGFVQETPTPEEQKRYDEAKANIDKGKGTEKDEEVCADWLRDTMVDNGGGTSGNNEGTFSTEHTTHDNG